METIMASASDVSFISSFPTYIILAFLFSPPSLSLFIAWARASNKMLNGKEERGHFCFILYLGGKAFSLSPVRMSLAVGFAVDSLCQASFLFPIC